MTLKEYQAKALTTAMFPPERGLEYCTLGLVGEVAELYAQLTAATEDSEAIMSEASDCLWYLAVLAHVAGIEHSELWALNIGTIRNPHKRIVVHSGEIANKVKKVIRDGKAVDKLWLAERLADCWEAMKTICLENDMTLEQVMEYNIAKLASRKERGVITGNGDNR